MPRDQLATVYRGIHAETVAAARELMARHDFLSARHLVDVGEAQAAWRLRWRRLAPTSMQPWLTCPR